MNLRYFNHDSMRMQFDHQLPVFPIEGKTTKDLFIDHFENIVQNLRSTYEMIEFEELEKLVTEKINNCITEIKNNNFDIKPVILNQTNKSCPNCKYASICFHTEKDNVYIDTKGDDENAELD